jgi:hypothetical protein
LGLDTFVRVQITKVWEDKRRVEIVS